MKFYVLLLSLAVVAMAEHGRFLKEEEEKPLEVQFSSGSFTIVSAKEGFWKAFWQAYSLIVVQEIGDRTFFLVIIFASRFHWLVLFLLAGLGMSFMHCLSTGIGFSMSWIPPIATKIFVTILFLGIGTYGLVWSLIALCCPKQKDKNASDSEDEFEEALGQVDKYEKKAKGEKVDRTDDGEKKGGICACEWMYNCQSKYLFFLAMLTCSEWGDKSQIAAISLALKAKTMEVVAVAIGGSLGHLTCISIALLFGTFVKQCMSEHVLALIGSCLFLGFGAWELVYEIILGNYKVIDPFKL